MRLCIFLLCFQFSALAAAPRVVTSITPVYEITAAIMTGVAEPGLIIDGHASAHHFAFKPSHMRLLQQADLVIWDVDRPAMLSYRIGINPCVAVMQAGHWRDTTSRLPG